ncbi:HNH endonuclease [Bradyrhizobium sp. WSM 1704]|uniref:HNH endonuclease signature motif containing protein n=1 Tax=Bradyrhizobium semiaridum TaxID=2821404 RepID=UPI001CE338DC|nr:HNH endonuclease signature motif containing protein [Bradyrhizobium semiaridum]MCA6124565.1 HNH endonuclease [Bradyrhizobium semiaridum]
MTLTAERLRAVLDYDPISGIFTGADGKVAGHIDPQGYRQIMIDGQHYLAHRLAWLFMEGEWPPRGVSFWNGDRADVSWQNLRLASQSQTAMGRKARSKLGIKGVSRTKHGFRARIFAKNRAIHLGTFPTEELAADAYAKAAREHFGEFARP